MKLKLLFDNFKIYLFKGIKFFNPLLSFKYRIVVCLLKIVLRSFLFLEKKYKKKKVINYKIVRS